MSAGCKLQKNEFMSTVCDMKHWVWIQKISCKGFGPIGKKNLLYLQPMSLSPLLGKSDGEGMILKIQISLSPSIWTEKQCV